LASGAFCCFHCIHVVNPRGKAIEDIAAATSAAQEQQRLSDDAAMAAQEHAEAEAAGVSLATADPATAERTAAKQRKVRTHHNSSNRNTRLLKRGPLS
jgi:hypothetical protein